MMAISRSAYIIIFVSFLGQGIHASCGEIDDFRFSLDFEVPLSSLEIQVAGVCLPREIFCIPTVASKSWRE
jgi:hypothetical protein